MADFNKAVLTAEGNELLASAVSGEQIEFIRLETGNGVYDGTEDLAAAGSLKSKQQEFPFLRYERVSEGAVMLVALVSNEGLSKGYRMTEIGVYGKLKGTDEEVLCSVSTAIGGKADFWPPFNGVVPVRIFLRYYISISQGAEPCITAADSVILSEIAAEVNRANTAELELSDRISGKVDKVSGKGLSTNDYSTKEKNKLKEIAAGAEVNVQSDWNVSDTESDAFIRNKPESLPASDVPSWAKDDKKPSYSKSEVGLGNVPNVSTNDQTPTFTEAEERSNIESGEKLSIILGKIRKVIADLSKTAFDGAATKWRTARNINGMNVDGSEDRTNYGTCGTAAATVAKTVDCKGFALVTGAEIVVKFTVTNSAASPTLNVNGTGAKPIFYRGAAIIAGYLAAGRTYGFRYNGAQYDLVGDIDTDVRYNNMSPATASAAGRAGLVPTPGAGKQNGYLRGDATWVTPTANLLATEPGIPLDQTMGKVLKDDIDALNGNLSELNVILQNLFVTKVITKSVTVQYLQIFSIPVPEQNGYRALGITGFSIDYRLNFFGVCLASVNNISAMLSSRDGTTITVSCSFYVLYVKNFS